MGGSGDDEESVEREAAADVVARAPEDRAIEPTVKTRKRGGRWLRVGIRVVIGVVLGLGLSEIVFSVCDHGAFPHLNVYEPDPRLGVKLRPGATERIRVGKNPITSIRIDAQGFRGADLPAPKGGEIIVVGDSQVFGLGVEENETASVVLSGLTGTTVINAGVPTYGPAEYNALTSDLLGRYEPSVVVYVVNFANDLFEASHPNTTRHAVWDGWAVRKETAPDQVTSFPGRALLYRESHAFHALRSFLYAHGEKLDDRGFASEGTVGDLVGQSRREHDRAEQANRALSDQRKRDISTTSEKEIESEAKLENDALDAFELRGYELGIAYQQSRDNPGDIVVKTRHFVEESRGATVTGQAIYNGAKVRQEIEDRIRAVVDKKIAIEEAKGARLTLSLEERDALKKRLAELRAAPLEMVRAWSPMTPFLKEVKATCDARGVRLLVVALPMDIQVSMDEWAKYGSSEKTVDMAASQILIDDLVASAERLGALGLDATPALRAAEPGAFLDGDIHMTPKGQRAFAEAIAAKLASSTPKPR